MGCAKDEESFQLRSTAEKASFWLLSFLASPKEEVAEADNVIVKVVENSKEEETFTWWCRKLQLAQFALYSSFLLKLPYARSIFFFSLDATATLVHTAAKQPKMFLNLSVHRAVLPLCVLRVFFAPFSDEEDEDPLLSQRKWGEKKKEKTFSRMNIKHRKKVLQTFFKDFSRRPRTKLH